MYRYVRTVQVAGGFLKQLVMSAHLRMRGALVGALVGDCLGAYWENESWIGTHPIERVREKIVEQVQQTKSGKGPVISYTDDTALTFAVAESLVECRGIDEDNMARKMTNEFFHDARRGYGPSIGTVFSKLKNSNFSDIYLPASQQFRGEGSCGNGASMRISPVALFGYNNDKILVDVVTKCSKLTHAHVSGVNGALLQAMAVKLALRAEGDVEPFSFLDRLLQQIQPFEENTDLSEANGASVTPTPSDVKVDTIKGQPTYTSRLRQIHALLSQQDPPSSAHDVQKLLGHGVLASRFTQGAIKTAKDGQAVPCAIFAFLKCCKESFEELIPYAISLGGDTDTIASMAGAIGGAYWGLEGIPVQWVECCEESRRAISLADELYGIVMEKE